MPGERFMSEEELKKWGVNPEDVGGEVLIGGEEENAQGISLEEALRAEGIDNEPKKKKTLLDRMKGKAQVIALSLVGFVSPGAVLGAHTGQNESPARLSGVELVEKKTELPRAVREISSLLGLDKNKIDVSRPVEFQGETTTVGTLQEAFDEVMTNSLKDEAGTGIARSCGNGEQCYLFYEGQIHFSDGSYEILEGITGLTRDELVFMKDVIQTGYLNKPGMRFPGTVTVRDEVGYGNLPSIMSEQEKRDFYDEVLFPRHVQMLENQIRKFGIMEMSKEDQREAKALLADLVYQITMSETAGTNLDIVYGTLENYRITKKHEDPRLQERKGEVVQVNAALDKLFDFYKQKSPEKSAEYEKLCQKLKGLVERKEHEHFTKLFAELEAQAQDSFINRGSADDWHARMEGELAVIQELDKDLM